MRAVSPNPRSTSPTPSPPSKFRQAAVGATTVYHHIAVPEQILLLSPIRAGVDAVSPGWAVLRMSSPEASFEKPSPVKMEFSSGSPGGMDGLESGLGSLDLNKEEEAPSERKPVSRIVPRRAHITESTEATRRRRDATSQVADQRKQKEAEAKQKQLGGRIRTDVSAGAHRRQSVAAKVKVEDEDGDVVPINRAPPRPEERISQSKRAAQPTIPVQPTAHSMKMEEKAKKKMMSPAMISKKKSGLKLPAQQRRVTRSSAKAN